MRRRVWRNSRQDRIGKPEFGLVPRARLSDLDPVRELPYWPAASKLQQQAGQMAASDRRAITPDLTACFPWGVHRRPNAPSVNGDS